MHHITVGMNKKQRTLSTFLCFSYVTCFLDSLNNCREVSKTFIPRECTTSLEILESNLSSRDVKKILLKKNKNILYLDVSRCYYLNSRTLAEILANFKCLRFLRIDNCHTLVEIPPKIEGLEVFMKNLWRIYNTENMSTPEDVIRVIVNGYNFICNHCVCHTRDGKTCLRKMKDFCDYREASSIIYTMDCLLDDIAPVYYFINDCIHTKHNQRLYFITFISNVGKIKLEWTLEQTYKGLWKLMDIWMA